MQSQLFIPKKCKVGFNVRSDTYTGKLGYVIYNDGTVWRKEKSWETWRHKEEGTYHEYVKDEKGAFIMNPTGGYKTTLETYGPTVKPIEFDNVPHAGFTLNKGVERNGYWGNGHSMCRIYDDRGFEFEISISNLMFILMSTDCLRKGLEGEFVYAWNGPELALMPVCCAEYKKASTFTELQGHSVGVKDLTPGCTYETKKQEELIYLGKFNWFEKVYVYARNHTECKFSKSHIFVDKHKTFQHFSGLDHIAKKLSDTPVSNYAALVDKLQKSAESGPVKKLIEHSTTVKFPEVNRYSYRSNDEKNISKFEEVYFKLLAPNKYEVYSLHSVNHGWDNDYEKRGQHLGYKMKATKVVTFVGDELVIKPSTTKIEDKLFTKKEIQSQSFVSLSFQTQSGKTHKLTL